MINSAVSLITRQMMRVHNDVKVELVTNEGECPGKRL